MATLVFTAVGQALGGPFGAALGSILGNTIDQQVFGPGPRKGPRLGDLSVQTSSYGTPIPRIYGRMRAAGTVIWATDLKEEESAEGGGKGSPGAIVYKYSVSMAVALSSRSIQSVGRIWADGKLMRGAGGDFKVRTGFRLLNGGEDQDQDPLIASAETVALAPAYRGLALAVFEDLDLSDYGSRIPSLTFEIIADDGPVTAGAVLSDAGAGAIKAGLDGSTLVGFAAHGRSRRDAIDALVDVSGIDLADDGAMLAAPPIATVAIAEKELGCDADHEVRPRLERTREAGNTLPSRLMVAYYDPERDYQAGLAHSSAGGGADTREEQMELAAVLDAGMARGLADAALARRWAASDRAVVRLPPKYMGAGAGTRFTLPDASQWLAEKIEVQGMVAIADLRRIAAPTPTISADAGRAVSEPDRAIGRTSLALFELPWAEGGSGVYIAGSNEGQWRSVPVEMSVNGAPVTSMALRRKAVLGEVVSLPGAANAAVVDMASTIEVQLADPEQLLTNADDEALMAGTNLAIAGSELIQFGAAEALGGGRWQLSRLLRGRRGTEWAMKSHTVGERFCLIDAARIVAVSLSSDRAGALVEAKAHGVADTEPLPKAVTSYEVEALRPPSPCRLVAAWDGTVLALNWVARADSLFGWPDGVDPPSGRFRVVVSSGGAAMPIETDATQISLAAVDLPASPATLDISVQAVGAQALSHPATVSISI